MTSHHWMTLLSSLVLLGLVLALAAHGWSGRRQRQAGIPAPPEVPEELDGRSPRWACSGQYVSTTRAGDWLDRVLVHGLGAKATGQAMVFDQGLVLVRDGAPDLWIPAESVQAVRRESGMAGKFVEKDGLVVTTWELGSLLVDTGFRTRDAADTPALVQALHAMAPAALDRLPPQEQMRARDHEPAPSHHRSGEHPTEDQSLAAR